MNTSKAKFSDNHTHTPQVITVMDDDDIQKNIIRRTGIIAQGQGSRRKSTTSTTEVLKSPAKKADKIGHRRRKTFHKILNADDEISFESIIPNDILQEVQQKIIESKPKQDAEKSPPQNKIQKLNKNAYSPDKTKKNSYRTDYLTKANPNTEFIQRVAFLRSCVNYMLKNAGKETIDFKYGDNTLSKLVNNYNCVSHEPEEIVLSD